VALENVHVVKLQPLQALFHAPRHSLRAEIKTLLVASAFGRHNVGAPRSFQSLQRLPQHFLRQCPSVIPSIFHTKSIYMYVGMYVCMGECNGSVRRSVEEVDAGLKGEANGGVGLFLRNCAEDIAQRRSSEPDRAHFQSGSTKLT